MIYMIIMGEVHDEMMCWGSRRERGRKVMKSE